MSDDNDESRSGKDSWLSQHDSIQNELLRMKEELIKEKHFSDKPEPFTEPPSDIRDDPETVSVPSSVPETGPSSQHVQPMPISSDEMNIKQLLGVDEDDEEKPAPKKKLSDSPSQQKRAPSRLEEGKIPVSPDLTGKIANILMLEDNLKRRKFEFEKKQRQIKLASPPKPPKGSKKKIEKEVRKEREPIEKEYSHYDRHSVIYAKPASDEKERSGSDHSAGISDTRIKTKRKTISIEQEVKAQGMDDDKIPVLEELTPEDVENGMKPTIEEKKRIGAFTKLRRLLKRG